MDPAAKPTFSVLPASGRKPRRLLRRLFQIAGAAILLFGTWLFAVWPPPLWYKWFWPKATAFMSMRADQADSLARHVQRRKDADGGRLPRHYQPVPLEQIATALPQTVLIGEDHRFFEHGGIDYVELREALGYRRDDFSWGNPRDRTELKRVLAAAWDQRDRIRGASTVTQQLAKNLYLSPSRNPLRKVKEAVTAYRLELALGKRRVLELYLNVVELGPEIWGVEAASQYYFKRSARQLSPEQAAMLAGTLPFPLRSNPGYRPGRMRWRQQFILRRWRGEPIEIPTDDDTSEVREAPSAAAVP